MEIDIHIMSGAGNLFGVIDNFDGKWNAGSLQLYVRDICRGKYEGMMPTEGMMVLQSHAEYDFECIFFNPDGSTGMMCGNGSRAIVRLAQTQGYLKGKTAVRFLMAGTEYEAAFTDDGIKVFFPQPVSALYESMLEMKEARYVPAAIIDVNSNHTVINTDDLGVNIFNLDIEALGREIRYSPRFTEKGINVNFYKRLNENTVKLRTYERGAEKETGACGTGSICTALTFSHSHGVSLPVNIITSSNQRLVINSETAGNGEEKITLAGPAETLYIKRISIMAER